MQGGLRSPGRRAICAGVACWISALTVMVAAPSGGAAGAAPVPLSKGARQFVNRTAARAMRAYHLPAVMIDISGPAGRYARAYGRAAAGSHAPARLGQHVRIAGVTDTFTATAILKQAQRHRLSLQDKLSRWVTGVPNGGRISVADLLDMRSGLYDFTRDPWLARTLAAHPLMRFSAADVVRILRQHRPQFAPGKRTRYSASNPVLLGLILQRVTSRSAPWVITRDVIRPAGLTRTSFPTSAGLPRPYAHGYVARGRRRLRDDTQLNPHVPWTAGAMVSTVGDLLRWGRVLGSGSLLSGRLRSRQARETRTRSGGYALGILRRGGWVGAAGNGFGYSTATFYDPATGAGIAVVATRSSAGFSPALRIFSQLARRLFGTSRSPQPQPSRPAPSPPQPPPPAAASPTPPVNQSAPQTSGTGRPGQMLTTTPGTWTGSAPIAFGYQWQRCDATGAGCQDISGATGSSYLIAKADVGSTLRVVVTASNAGGSADAPSAVTAVDPVVVGVGDIACAPGDTTNACQQQQTANLTAAQQPDDVLVLGDNQYQNGSFAEYTGAGAYNATWGQFNPIVHPVPGNHEYGTAGAAGYFDYFGSAIAGAPPGNYSFNLGNWHIIALNSDCSDSGCSNSIAGATTTAQVQWLQSDLASNSRPCVMAYWHHPLFSQGYVGNSPGVKPLWTALYGAHADVVLNGHDHLYERYARQDPSGAATPNGIREFVVGTGGESLFTLNPNPPSTLEYADDQHYGVLVLKLHADSYEWQFKTTDGTTEDSGTTACHGADASAAIAHGPRERAAGRIAGRRQPKLVFDARPVRTSPAAAARRGLPVAIHCSRACDVNIDVRLRGRRIAAARETEDQIPRPRSVVYLRLPRRALRPGGRLVLRFAAVDAANHHRIIFRSLRLARRR